MVWQDNGREWFVESMPYETRSWGGLSGGGVVGE